MSNVRNANPTHFCVVTRTRAQQNLDPKFDPCMGFFDFCHFLYGKKLEQNLRVGPILDSNTG